MTHLRLQRAKPPNFPGIETEIDPTIKSDTDVSGPTGGGVTRPWEGLDATEGGGRQGAVTSAPAGGGQSQSEILLVLLVISCLF